MVKVFTRGFAALFIALALTPIAHAGIVATPLTPYTAAIILRRAGPAHPVTIIPAGDSITANGTTTSGGPWIFSSGYAETAIRLAGNLRQISNAGVSGNTSTQLLARYQADVIANHPDVAMIEICTNDIPADPITNSIISTCFNNVERMVLASLADGELPVIVVPPAKNSAPVSARTIVPYYYDLAQYYNLPLIDNYRSTVNASTGNYISTYTADGTHPSAAGISAIAAPAASVLSNLPNAGNAPYLASFSETTVNNVPNLIRNGSFAQQQTVGVPDNWVINTTNATYTATTSAALPYTGFDFVYTKTVSGGAYALSGGTVSSGFAVGDTLVFSGRIKVSGLPSATASGFQLGLDFGGSNAHARPFYNWVQNGDFPFSVEVVVPAGSTNFVPTLFVSDVGTYTVDNLTVSNKTARQAIWRPGKQ